MERPLTALFVDCDSYFATVKQPLDPALRERPVGLALWPQRVYYGSVQESREDAPMRISFTHIPDLDLEQD